MCAAVPRCLRESGIPGSDVAAIACDGTSFTGVFCDTQAVPLRPAILWMDLRAADEAAEVEATRDPVLDHCGRRISPEWLLPKVLWVQRHEADVYRQSARIVEGVDWLIHRLCGRWVTSTGNAAGKRHWTPGNGWPAAFYDTLGLPGLADKSPDHVLYVGEAAGRLLPEAAEALGLSRDCVVAHAGMDGWTAPIGKDCFRPGCLSLILGTSTVAVLETDSPRLIDGVMGPFPDGIRRGRAVYEAGQTSGGSTVGWLLSILGIDVDSPKHEALQREAAEIPPGSNGLVVFDAWRGNRTPYYNPHARGTICGLTLEHGPAHLYRALLEGCAFGVRNVFTTLDQGGCPIAEVRTCGSGAANTLWTQIIADATGLPLLVSSETQATCLGSAVCAAVACGAFDSLEDAAAAMAPDFHSVEPHHGAQDYEPYYALYLETYARMKPTMGRLSRLSGEIPR